MENKFNDLVIANAMDIIRFASPIIFALGGFVLFGLLLSRSRIGSRIIKSFFLLEESDSSSAKDVNHEIEKLKFEIKNLSAQIENPLSDSVIASVKAKMDLELYSDVPKIVNSHLERLSEERNDVVRFFENTAEKAANDHLKKIPMSELVAHAAYREAWDQRRRQVEVFDKSINAQLSSANSIRIVMMNLFVLTNMSLIFGFIFIDISTTERVLASIFGLYVSLSAFIIYIYRASNARAASLLSLKEDEKKLNDVFQFLTAFKKGSAFTNNEVEIIRMLLINRLERERGSDHPYEVILKGVSNSNILMKGGKVSTLKSVDK